MWHHLVMVKGRQLTPAEKRAFLSKIRAVRSAEAALDALVLELNEDGVSVQSLEDASGERGTATYVNHSTLHRQAVRAREKRDAG